MTIRLIAHIDITGDTDPMARTMPAPLQLDTLIARGTQAR